MASLSNSTSGRSKRRVAMVKQHNREDTCEGLTKYCHHKLLAPRWTSWSEGNLGRRFCGCRYYFQDSGCGYFAWHDKEYGERANAVINELLDDIDKLYDENMKLRRGKEAERVCDEVAAIHSEMRKLKRRQERNENEQRKLRLAMGSLLITWVWLLYLYMRG